MTSDKTAGKDVKSISGNDFIADWIVACIKISDFVSIRKVASMLTMYVYSFTLVYSRTNLSLSRISLSPCCDHTCS